jgi:hypothetical protein
MSSASRLETLTRAGFAARGVMYGLIGFLALKSGRTEDGAGVLEYLAGGSGRLLVGLMALGFFGYALWRFSEALADTEGHGSDAKGMVVRTGGVVSGLVHLGLGIFAVTLAGGSGGGGSEGSSREGAATALSLPGGETLLLAVSAALAATGLYQLIKAAKGDFLRYLDPQAARREWVGWLGRGGYAARGVVFLVMAWFLFQAGRESSASEAAGMGEALGSLPPTLQLLVAAGLFLFGLFSFVEARHRRINDPSVLERLGAMART